MSLSIGTGLQLDLAVRQPPCKRACTHQLPCCPALPATSHLPFFARLLLPGCGASPPRVRTCTIGFFALSTTAGADRGRPAGSAAPAAGAAAGAALPAGGGGGGAADTPSPPSPPLGAAASGAGGAAFCWPSSALLPPVHECMALASRLKRWASFRPQRHDWRQQKQWPCLHGSPPGGCAPLLLIGTAAAAAACRPASGLSAGAGGGRGGGGGAASPEPLGASGCCGCASWLCCICCIFRNCSMKLPSLRNGRAGGAAGWEPVMMGQAFGGSGTTIPRSPSLQGTREAEGAPPCCAPCFLPKPEARGCLAITPHHLSVHIAIENLASALCPAQHLPAREQTAGACPGATWWRMPRRW